jgi:pyrrolidone-carboxylate peptidase
MTILLTGFDPFGGLESNSSWEVASRVAHKRFDEHTVHVEKMPVSMDINLFI